MPRIHVTVNGHRIEYPDPDQALQAFLELVQRYVEEPAIGEDALISLVYGPQNPIMNRDILPGRGVVTREVLRNPVYAVLTDLLYRKELQRRGLTSETVARRYTLTAAEVADKLGVHVSTVTRAARERRVPSWIREGEYRFDPETLRTMSFAEPRR